MAEDNKCLYVIDEMRTIYDKHTNSSRRAKQFRGAMSNYCDAMRGDLPPLKDNEFEFDALCTQCRTVHRFRQSIEVL